MRSQPGTKLFNLEHVLQHIRAISQAPGLSDLYLSGTSLEAERETRYKAVDQFGNVFLVMNPAVWPEKIVNGMVIRERPQPKLVLTAKDAVEEARVGPKLTVPPVTQGGSAATQQALSYGFL